MGGQSREAELNCTKTRRSKRFISHSIYYVVRGEIIATMDDANPTTVQYTKPRLHKLLRDFLEDVEKNLVGSDAFRLGFEV